MNELMNEKTNYETPFAQIVVFPQQDILTISEEVELPLDWI